LKSVETVIKECPIFLIYLIEFHLSKEKLGVTSLAVHLHKGSCQLGVRPLCYKKNETNRERVSNVNDE